MTRTNFVRWLQTMFAVDYYIRQDDTMPRGLDAGVELLHANPDLVEQLVKPNLPEGCVLLRGRLIYFDLEHGQPGDYWWKEMFND
jgi:hypothetical protein